MQNAECRMQNYGVRFADGLNIGTGGRFFGLPPALLRSSTPLINEGGEGVAEGLGDCHGLCPRNDSLLFAFAVGVVAAGAFAAFGFDFAYGQQGALG